MTASVMRRRGLSVLVLAALTLPAQAAAQAAKIRISQMEIELWPEYDEPSVLVIYDGHVDSSVTVPARITFVIPDSARIHMAGALDAQGGHHHAMFEARPVQGGMTEVSYELETRHFYMEFYYNPLKDGDQRDFRYPIVSRYPVASLTVVVQHPRRAEQFRTTPSSMDRMTDENGFTYTRVSFNGLQPGRDRAVAVSYVKSDRAPSVARGGAGGQGSMRGILIVGGLLLVGAVGYGVFANSRRKRPLAASAGNRAARRQEERVAHPSPEVKYCTACGARLERSDKFCSECGTAARRKG